MPYGPLNHGVREQLSNLLSRASIIVIFPSKYVLHVHAGLFLYIDVSISINYRRC